MPTVTQCLEVLDVHQLKRIEATHRGFLYQHLFAAGCLLKGVAGVESMLVEHDEDLEILADGRRHIYAQVKMRSGKLLEGEVEGFFTRSKELAAAHSNGERQRIAEFWLITNAEISTGLAARLAAENIGLWSPGAMTRDEPLLPPPFTDVATGFAWCATAAAEIALTRLSPEALVWKLAAVVAYRSAGLGGGHAILTSELAALFELFAAQLHHFPEGPAAYRPQEEEPELEGDGTLLVSCVSGAGKTAWASYCALHSGAASVYFDTTGLPDAAVPSALLREAVAQIAIQPGVEPKDAIQPGASGLEGLRGVDFLVRRAGIRLVVVIDNVHTVTSSTIHTVVGILRSCRLVILGQPTPVIAELEALIGVEAVALKGWSLITIAAEFESAQALIDPATANRVRQLTGGIPRFVSNAAGLTRRFYSGDAAAFCESMETSSNTTRTAQELILRETLRLLSSDARRAVALLSLARFPLSEDECFDFLSAHEAFCSVAPTAEAIRELRDWGVVERLMSGALVLHDAFVVLAAALFDILDEQVKVATKRKLAAVIEKSTGARQIARLMVYCRLLPQIGRVDVLADIAGSLSEQIHEQGRSSDLEMVLQEILWGCPLP